MKKSILLFAFLFSTLIGFGQWPDNVMSSDCNTPLEGNPWNIQLLYSSQNVQAASYSPVLVGDIDNNGVTDIVVARYDGDNYRSNGINVYNGQDLSLQYSFVVPDTIYLSNGPYAIGSYPKSDGGIQGAIFTHCLDKRIRAYTIDGTLLNVSNRPTSCDGMVSLADFNGDGYPEVYAGSDIFDAATLKWLCSGPMDGNKGLGFRGSPTFSMGSYHHTYYAMSLAYNALGDEKQELICGNTIYNVNIVSRTNPSQNTITVNKTITPPSGCPQDGHVSIADFDLDGETEILVIRDNTNDQIVDNTYFYAYKPSNGKILFQNPHLCASTSYVFIGNTDSDPYPEIVYLENQPNGYNEEIYCWRYTPENGFEIVWTQFHDDRSGMTSMTLFDFNQDNIMELVYRDNNNLRIINASGKSHITGNDTIRPYNIYTRTMAAGTGIEYPVVADINGDGRAEIIVTGMLDQYYTNDIGYGRVHVFGNPGNWSLARHVWNQYMYHVTNVNEDLTIPTFCFNTATAFTGTDNTIRRPYNNFLQQAGYITPTGEAYNPSGYVEADYYGTGCDTYLFHGVTFTESGNYEYLAEYPLSCDTLFTVHVQLGETVHVSKHESACDSYTWNDTTYTESGIYQQTFTSAQGCDSIVTLHLDIANQIMTDIEDSACDSYTWNDTTYTESGIYQQTFTSAQGCDSIVTLHLDIANQIMTNIEDSSCDSYRWNDTTYTESGIYQQTFTSVQGCDSIVTLDLTIKTSLYVSPISGESLIYYQNTGDYNYSIDPVEGCFGYDWTLDGPWTILSSPDSPECTININSLGTGTLKVRVYTECGFIERSLDINHNILPNVVIYPNPTQSDFNILLDGMKGETAIMVYNYLGQIISSVKVDTNIDSTIIPYSLKGKAAGVYFVAVYNNYKMIIKKVIKDHPATYGFNIWEW